MAQKNKSAGDIPDAPSGLGSKLRRELLVLGISPLVLAASGCGGGGNGTPPESPANVGRVVTTTCNSAKTNFSYPISIFVPASYDSGSDSYPTIYALDGDAMFDGSNTRFTNLQNVLLARGTKAILVGIGGTSRRQVDFNFPGAYAYHDFITLELMPLIESQFRTDVRTRLLTGLSTGGSFAATALFIEAPVHLYFTDFISVEAAFWQQLDTVNALEQQMYDAVKNSTLPATLILARGTGPNTNASYVIDMYDRMAARNYPGLQLVETAFPFDHVGTDVPAFDDAMARIFG